MQKPLGVSNPRRNSRAKDKGNRMVVRDLKLGLNVNTIASNIVLASIIALGTMIFKSSKRLVEVDLHQQSVLVTVANMQNILTAQTADNIRLQVKFDNLTMLVEKGIADRYTGEQGRADWRIQDRVNQSIERRLKAIEGGK